jgi:hypothetical protein
MARFFGLRGEFVDSVLSFFSFRKKKKLSDEDLFFLRELYADDQERLKKILDIKILPWEL